MFDNKWQKKEMPLVSLIGMGGGIASPAFLASIVLNILKPTVFSPVDDTGVPDFDYTAESSAITDISTVDALGDASAFSTTLYSGNGNGGINGQSINTGIDNASESLVWIKARTGTGAAYLDHCLFDTLRGPENIIRANDSGSTLLDINSLLSFDTDGYATGGSGLTNVSGNNYVAWNFRAEPGFLDIVTFSGDGVNGRAVPHNLGTTPAFIMLKNLTLNENWMCYHKDAGVDGYLAAHERFLQINNETAAFPPNNSGTPDSAWGNTAPDENNFYLGASVNSNSSGSEFVAYLFADNPSNQIQCGTYTGNGTSSTTASASTATHLDFDPEWLLVKNIDSAGSNWCIVDSTRGNIEQLNANNTEAQSNTVPHGLALFDGHIQAYGSSVDHNKSGDKYIYVAIGSPKVTVSNTQLTLTDTTVSRVSDGSLIGGTSIDQVLTVGETVQADTAISSTVAVPVFNTTTYSGTGSTMSISTGIDLTTKGMLWFKGRGGSGYQTNQHVSFLFDSERNDYGSYLGTHGSDGQGDFASYGWAPQPATDGTISNLQANLIHNNVDWVNWAFRAAPGFFDIVTYDGDPNQAYVPQNISHNLGSVPGAMIIKVYSHHGVDWVVYHKELGATQALRLNHPDKAYTSTNAFNDTEPTDSEFTVGAYSAGTNNNGRSYVNYLFADTPGLIKCGQYTAVGSDTFINLGFKPAWVMIKRVDQSQGWLVADDKRPATDGWNAFLSPDSAATEDATNKWILFTPSGFNVSQSADIAGSNYVYIAIAENPEADITTQSTASGTVSASSGNTITLSNTTGTWSTGMKVQGATTDTKDNPDPIKAENVSLTSSAPTAERNVSTWGDAVWEIATDENFTQNVQTANTALSATGTQAGPSFTFEPETGYYARTKYTALGQESEWSDVTYFLTEGLPVHWITTISDPNGINLGQQSSLVTDSQNNVLVTTVTTQNHHNLVKLDPQGNISWQRKYSKSGVNFYYQYGQNCIDVDSNDNPFIGVMGDASGGADMITAKYSSSGTLEWQRKINFTNDRTEAVATDSSGSVFNIGYTEGHQQMGNGSGYTINVTKHDSNGNHLFTRAYGDSDDRGYYGKSAHVDSSGDLLVIGFFTHSSGTIYPYLQKVNGTDGSIIFGKTLGSGNHAGGAAAVTTDSSGNIYAAWRARDTNNVYGILFAKYNSSGTLQWKKEIYDGNNAKYVSAVDVDSSDNIYIWGSSDEPNATQGAAGLLIKMDSSGSMVWQRLISGPNTINHGGMSVDTADNIAICGQVYPGGGGNASIFVGKVPSDGSLMGTYNTPFGTYVYAEASNSVRDATSRTSVDYTFPRSPLQTGGFTNNENYDSNANNMTSSPTVLE